MGRIPITWQDQDREMDFFAILVHVGDTLEETVLVPVPSSFFDPNFFPLSPRPTQLASLSPTRTPTPIPNPIPTPSPTPAPLVQPIAPTHTYPPPPHILAQLGGIQPVT